MQKVRFIKHFLAWKSSQFLRNAPTVRVNVPSAAESVSKLCLYRAAFDYRPNKVLSMNMSCSGFGSDRKRI